MIIKTAELEGAALDWAVAKAIGANIDHELTHSRKVWAAWGDLSSPERFNPSEDWAQGGPLIDQYKVEFRARGDSYECRVEMWDNEGIGYDEIKTTGPSHLVAAMRAIAMAELGDAVDVPEELCQ